MKSGIHPENYRTVVFKDMSNGDIFFSRSTVNTKENIEIDSNELKDDEYLILEALKSQSSITVQEVIKILGKKTVFPIITGS